MRKYKQEIVQSNYFLNHKQGFNSINTYRLFNLSLAYWDILEGLSDLDSGYNVLTYVTAQEVAEHLGKSVKYGQEILRKYHKTLLDIYIEHDDGVRQKIVESVSVENGTMHVSWNEEVIHHFDEAAMLLRILGNAERKVSSLENK